MFVTIFPALSWKISDSTYCLDLNHGKWLAKSETEVEKGQELYECNYQDIYFDGFQGFMKSLMGGFVKHRISWPCPLSGTLKTFGAMYDHGDRDVTIPLRLRSKDDISALRPMFYIASQSQEALSPMIVHRNWFNFIERNHEWMDSAMQRSSYYNPSWLELVQREQKYLEQQTCPVLPLDEFKRIWYR
ncbi:MULTISPECIES: hypothetical protein [unclassified Phaeobacter]|uniref:hypothetical protein n=1 Tax=unclassified Phaeobacter TaxID=2621772 RepID=UPI003A85E58E